MNVKDVKDFLAMASPMKPDYCTVACGSDHVTLVAHAYSNGGGSVSVVYPHDGGKVFSFAVLKPDLDRIAAYPDQSATVEFSKVGARVRVNFADGEASAVLNVMDDEPQNDAYSTIAAIALPREFGDAMLEHALRAVDKKELHGNVLSGVLVSCRDGKLMVCGGDGFRLNSSTTKCDALDFEFVLPYQYAEVLRRAWPGITVDATLRGDGVTVSRVRFSFGGTAVDVPVVDGKYPDVNKIFEHNPRDNAPRSVFVNAKELSDAVKFVGRYADGDKDPGVSVYEDVGDLVIAYGDSVRQKLGARFSGTHEIDVLVNHKYMTDSIPRGVDELTIRFISNLSPVFVSCEEGGASFVSVIMPMSK